MTFIPINGVMPQALHSSKIRGVRLAIVVDNRDGAANPGYRVKVKLPWLNEQATTSWARVAIPMGGPDRGTYVLPEIDDQVLGVFEQGTSIGRSSSAHYGARSKKQEPVEVNQPARKANQLMHQSDKTARRDRTATLALLLLPCLAATACTGDPAAAPDATFKAGPFTIKPGEERVICTYVRSDNDETVDITRFVTDQTKGAHHIVVYDVDHPIDLPPTDCSQGGQPSWRPMIVSQIPHQEHSFVKGVGYRIAPHQQWVLETHYINTTDEPTVMSGTFSMTYAKPGEVTTPAAIYGIGTMNIDIPPYSKWSTQVACSPPFEFTLQTMFGHEHAHGTGLQVHFARGGGAAEPLYSMTEWEDPPIEQFNGGLKVVPGDTISVSCDWQNDSPNRVRMPHEMCFALGYYWPAEGALSCMAGGQKDACLCGIQKPTDAGPGGARLSVSVRREAAIQGAIGELDTGAPIQCMLWRAEDWTGAQPTAGAQPRHARDAIDVPLKTTADVATINFDDVTPGDYVVSCMMDSIGGGFMPGSGDIINSVPARVTAIADKPSAASVVLDIAIP